MSLRSEEHTSELQSRLHLVCRLLLEKKTQAWAWHSHNGAAPQVQLYEPNNPFKLAGCASTAMVVAAAQLRSCAILFRVFFLKDTPPPEIYPFPLPGALPI